MKGLFICHQGRQRPEVLASFLSQIHSRRTDRNLGVSVFLPRYVPATTARILAEFAGLGAITIADPEAHRMEVAFEKRGIARSHLDYLATVDPEKHAEAFVNSVLLAQVNAGASVLVSPWLTHGMGPGSRQLRASRRFALATAKHPLVSSREWWIGVAISENVLRVAEERDDFLDELVDWPSAPVYLRFWKQGVASYSQYGDEEVLKGLRNVVSALRSNGRDVVIPQSGLIGWLMTGFGAQGFGAGISSSLHSLATGPAGGGGAEPLPWYFVPQLLGFVLREELPIIAKVPGFRACDCPYCRKLAFTNGPPWDRESAGLHFLWFCTEIAAEQARARDPVVPLKRRVRAAEDFWDTVQQAGVVLDERSVPNHLGAWSAAIA